MDLIIKNGTLVTASEVVSADLGIAGEKIVAIGEGLDGAHIIDARDQLVFPGFIDPHVHLQMSIGDIASTDDFLTGTIAAACGGTTTIIDFIEALDDISLTEATQARRAEADPKVVIDYSLHLTGNSTEPAFLKEIAQLARQGYTSVKFYTTYEGLMIGDGEILQILEVAKENGLLPIVHCENDAIIARLKRQFIAAGRVEPCYHPLSRPCVAEAEAVRRVLALARVVGVPVYIVHLSCRESLEEVERARAAGQTVYAEVTPQHLLLDQSEYGRKGFEGAKFCCAPPLRPRENLDALWRGLADGRLQTVGTDHCPWYYKTHRQRGRHDFTQIPNGMPGIETRVSLMYDRGVRKGRLGLNRFVDACATTPAKLFGLYPQKGSILVGGDADLVIFDPEREVTLSQSSLHQNVDYCPYEGWEVGGYPMTVLSRGRMIVRDGEFVGEAGAGRFLARQSARQ